MIQSVESQLSSNDTIVIIVLCILIIQVFFIFLFTSPYIRKLWNAFMERRNNNHPKQQMFVISQIAESCLTLRKLKKGALIVIERNDKTESQILDGEFLDSRVSKALLVNIFEGSKTPLHDGAVVIRGERIAYAGGFISTLTTKKTSRTYGTRHRSAIGLTQKTDAIAVIVSEESGKISIASEGVIKEVEDLNVFEELSNILIGENYYKK